MLGIPPLPEKGDYFIDLGTYLAQREDGGKPGGPTGAKKRKQRE